MQTTSSKILSRIYGHGRGWCFSQIDFSDITVRSTINTILQRAVETETIRRVMRGLYDYPRYSNVLQTYLAPDMSDVASALARKYGWNLIPEGSTALHMLGLDTQVPAQFRYFTNGPNRTYSVLGTNIQFLHQKTKHTTIGDVFAATVVQALLALGQGNIKESHRNQIASQKSIKELKLMLKHTRQISGWIQDELHRIYDFAKDPK